MPPEQNMSLDELQALSGTLHLQSPDELRQSMERLMANLPPEVQAVFRQHAADAAARAPRPRLCDLSAAELRALGGEELDSVVYDYVSEQVDKSDDPVAALLALPRGLQVFYLSFIVEVEVMNGGLDQFFSNPSGAMAKLVAPALRDLGAHEAAALFERAMSVASDEAALDRLNAPFVALAQAFPALRAGYVTAHEAQFLPGR